VSAPFSPHQGLVVVTAQIWGPTGDSHARLALDTGATVSLIRTAILVSIGYDPATAPDRVQMTTGSGVEYAARLPIDRLAAIGQTRHLFPVVAHTLPPSAPIDGLLGLDFMRGRRLTVDFRRGVVSIR
jgi:predicted aspartyl protease